MKERKQWETKKVGEQRKKSNKENSERYTYREVWKREQVMVKKRGRGK